MKIKDDKMEYKELNKNDLLFTSQGLTMEEFKEMMEKIYKDFKGEKDD